jgi:hypothetical protein
MSQKFSVLSQISINQEQAESKEAFKRGFETTEEIVTAYNSLAGRLIDDECSGEMFNKCKVDGKSGKHEDSMMPLDVSKTLLLHGGLDSMRQVTSK